MDLKETDILGDDISQHWYYRSKAKAMSRLLGKEKISTILDVGAGSGVFSRHLLANSSANDAWCVDISYNDDSDALENGKPVHFRRFIGQLDADLVLLMDVLEHVDDDVGLLDHYANKVPRGARFLISVPAFQFLWSDHDIFLEHKRRYQLKQIEDVTRRAGLTVVSRAYYFGAIFPIAAIIRLSARSTSSGDIPVRSQLAKHHPLVNGTLATLCNLELPLMQFTRVAGLSAFCLAEKR